MEKPAFKKTYPTMEGEVLKRMPAGYPSDFKYDEILRHKDFSVVSYKPDEFFFEPDWMDKAVEDFKLLYPFNQFLNYTVDEYLGRVWLSRPEIGWPRLPGFTSTYLSKKQGGYNIN